MEPAGNYAPPHAQMRPREQRRDVARERPAPRLDTAAVAMSRWNPRVTTPHPTPRYSQSALRSAADGEYEVIRNNTGDPFELPGTYIPDIQVLKVKCAAEVQQKRAILSEFCCTLHE